MQQQAFPQQNPFAAGLDAFARLAPSTGWSTIVFPECPECSLWVWYKPADLMTGLVLNLPAESWAVYPYRIGPFTLRRLIQLAGIDPVLVLRWTLHGAAYDGMQGTNPLFDQPLPPPLEGVEPNIQVEIGVPATPAVMPGDAMLPVAPPALDVSAIESETHASASASGNALEILEGMEKDWLACCEIEKDLTRMRKKLVDLGGRLKSLNRDLNSDERLYSNGNDKKDWADARRGLRSGMARCHMYIKNFDIGDTSTAGRGKWIAQIYKDYVEPRVPFDGIQQAEQEFIIYRKTMLTLQSNMSNAFSQAGQQAERKAQQVLNTIQAKVRKGGARKHFIDVVGG